MSFTLTTSGAILLKAGKNVSSDLSGSANLAVFSDMAESTLCAITRKDWVANYSSVGTNFKQILSDTVSSMAAIPCISYDMSGYTSRLEAQTMLDVNKDIVATNIAALKTQEIQEVMD